MRQLPKDNNNNNNKKNSNSNSRSSETACENRVLVAVDALEAVAKVVAALVATVPSRRF